MVKEIDGHTPGCPAITDDDSDQVLSDYQRCACPSKLWPVLENKSTISDWDLIINTQGQAVKVCVFINETLVYCRVVNTVGRQAIPFPPGGDMRGLCLDSLADLPFIFYGWQPRERTESEDVASLSEAEVYEKMVLASRPPQKGQLV